MVRRSCHEVVFSSLATSLDRHTVRSLSMTSASMALKCSACGADRSARALLNLCSKCLTVLSKAAVAKPGDTDPQARRCEEIVASTANHKPQHSFVDNGWCVVKAGKPINTLGVVGDNIVIGIADASQNVQVHSLLHDLCLMAIDGASKTAKSLALNGSELFVGFFDGTVRVYSLDSGVLLRTVLPPNSDDWVYRIAMLKVNGSWRLFRAGRSGRLTSLDARFQGKLPNAPISTEAPKRSYRCKACSKRFSTAAEHKHHQQTAHVPEPSFSTRRKTTFVGAQDAFKKLIEEERAAWTEIINKKAPVLPSEPVVPAGHMACDIVGCKYVFKTAAELSAHCQEYDHSSELDQLSNLQSLPRKLLGLADKATNSQVRERLLKGALEFSRQYTILAQTAMEGIEPSLASRSQPQCLGKAGFSNVFSGLQGNQWLERQQPSPCHALLTVTGMDRLSAVLIAT
eukprot:TRINITY_DN8972_c0_g2_i3.p2 TRINITY_DN8972_c0_g2~~TRINITY_DN8972_c0_g2_i3.p2  ORF type:complete len:457 (+),score=53.80 TRINITY_DN8972_c0_g2_i3:1837-3207(+)